jgi:hypothetical protein
VNYIMGFFVLGARSANQQSFIFHFISYCLARQVTLYYGLHANDSLASFLLLWQTRSATSNLLKEKPTSGQHLSENNPGCRVNETYT